MVRAAKEELEVELFFEEIGAAFGIAKVFGNIAAGLDLEGNGAALKGGVKGENTLPVGMVETFGNAD